MGHEVPGVLHYGKAALFIFRARTRVHFVHGRGRVQGNIFGFRKGRGCAIIMPCKKNKEHEMFTKLLFKRILPTLVALALLTLGGLWLYGYFGVKQGWIGVADYPGLNAVTKHGADAAGGMGALMKAKVKGAFGM